MDISTNLQGACGVSSCVVAPAKAVDNFEASARWLDTLSQEPLEEARSYAVEGLLATDALAVIYGVPYSGKSGLTSHLAQCIVLGASFFGRSVVRAMPVFYVAVEGAADVRLHFRAVEVVARRTQPDWSWPAGMGAVLDAPLDLTDESSVDGLSAFVQRHAPDGAAVVIDVLLQAIGNADITDNADMLSVMRRLRRLGQACRGPVIVVHHANRTEARSILGATAILASADVHIRVEPGNGKTPHTWAAEKIKGGKPVSAQPFRFEAVSLGLNGLGQEETSCIVVPVPAEATTKKEKAPPATKKAPKKTTTQFRMAKRP